MLVSICLQGCIETDKEPQLFELLPKEETNVTFANSIITNDTLNALKYDYLYNGGGVAVGDINNDGLPDLYFSGNMVSSKLYLNKGGFVFEDITEKAGVGTSNWATGVSMVDINADGYLDIYVCIANKDSLKSKNLLFINNGNNIFSEKAAQFGLDDNGYSTQAAFIDYDLDGDLDLYMLTNAYETFNRNVLRSRLSNGEGASTDRLYRNNGDDTFSNVSKEAGILAEGYGLGVAIADINQDGWPDIYVANDFITNDLIWINNGDGTFNESASKMVKHQSHNGMGTDIADFNNDGLPDIVVMDMLPDQNLRQKTMFPNINYDRFMMNLQKGYIPQYVRNTLQLNNGNGSFSEIGQLSGIHATDWSWSALFADYDNDGLKDLFITNGYRKDITDLDYIVYKSESNMLGTDNTRKQHAVESLSELPGAHIHNFMFKNTGNISFNDVSSDWGLSKLSYSNGAAFADLDNDGDLDLVVNNIDSEAFIYKNSAEKLTNNNYLQIKLKGKSPNNAGLGAKVTLYYEDKLQYHDHNLYRGYKSTVDDVIHFGLGDIDRVEKLIVIWPDGYNQVIRDLSTNQRIILDYNDATDEALREESKLKSKKILFNDVSGKNGIDYKHQESDFIDFKVQPLVPHKFSQNGPGIAVGDVTGNGLDDFYIGGAAGFSGKVYYQVEPGKFESRDLTGPKPEEDMGCLFFDADQDGDLDLYIVSGGSDYAETSKNYQDRLYVNDGKGNFALDPTAIPDILSSGSCVVAADYDQDGDLDLFVGGRITPGKYPLPAKSFILQNNGGKFEDVTYKISPEVGSIGLVTAALWTDFDNDTKIDLILAGEWMPITLLKNTGNGFKNITGSSGLEDSNGWWNSLAGADFDGDGDIDYVAGNLGLNSFYKASDEHPVKVYAKDYDQNGSMDPILTHFIDGKEYPAHPRDNLIDQITAMRGRFPRYSEYGNATMDKVLTASELEGAYTVKSNNFSSSFIENKGNGVFEMKPLPVEAQISPIFGMFGNDYDEDGHPDILISGNSYSTETQLGWYDASIGLYLKGDGQGNFLPVHVNESGFFVDKDAKGMAELYIGNNQSIVLVGCNDDSLKTFQSTSQKDQYLSIVEPDDAYAIMTLKDGRKVKREFYYGSTYLSQSSRVLKVPKDISSLVIYNFRGDRRDITKSIINVIAKR